MTHDAHEIVLEVSQIEKRFGAAMALGGVDLTLRRGEVHALIGENGAGKSTLMKVLSGAHTADRGSMRLEGQPYAPRNPLDARGRGVAMIYQELTLAPHLTVAQNVLLGREPHKLGIVDRHAMQLRVSEALSWLHLDKLDPARTVGGLSPGVKQLIEVARALVGNARLVVMDEPTSSLSRTEVEQLFQVIERLRTRGVAVIYISHFLEEVRRVAQRYTVLRDGQSVDAGLVPSEPSQAAAFNAHVIEAMAGRKLHEVYPQVPHAPAEIVLELDSLAGKVLPHSASLELRRGEIFGIAGLLGAGRTELVRALFGLEPVRSGSVRVSGRTDRGGQPPFVRLAQGMGLLSENRKEEGLALGMSIADNLTLSRPPARWGLVMRDAQAEATSSLGARLKLRYQHPTQPVGQLSGGNQQKVALLRLLHHDVDVLLLDEPTRGVDVGSKAEIYRLIGELAAQNKAILLISSYLPELLGVCDRIAVMSRGKLGAARPVEAWTEASLLEACIETAPNDAQGAAHG